MAKRRKKNTLKIYRNQSKLKLYGDNFGKNSCFRVMFTTIQLVISYSTQSKACVGGQIINKILCAQFFVL